ncbi:putative porin [uncultured Shewanella sp.]|uniref:putative porin n=1 Tax=uncultured Shewanella sp. TaxID=173975 RepID=UPI002602F43E|nr:putative porin [uncultured Shewanella sp.]
MKKSRIAAALFLSLTSASAFSVNDNSYHNEAQLEFQSSSENFSDGDWDLNYRYYASPVDQSKVPYALSGFLAQSSSIGAHFKFNNDITDYRTYGIQGQYVFDSKWYIDGVIDASDNNPDASSANNATTYGIGGGYYFNDTSVVYLTYRRTDQSQGMEDTDRYTLGVKGYLPVKVTEGILMGAELNNYHYSTAGVTSTTDYNIYADWYITRPWSFGASYTLEDQSDTDDIFSINTAYFLRLTDMLSARIEVEKQLDPNEDGVTGKLILNGRF